MTRVEEQVHMSADVQRPLGRQNCPSGSEAALTDSDEGGGPRALLPPQRAAFYLCRCYLAIFARLVAPGAQVTSADQFWLLLL